MNKFNLIKTPKDQEKRGQKRRDGKESSQII